MTIQIETETEVPFEFEYQNLAHTVIAYTIDREQFPYEAEISLLLTDDPGICEINRIQREINQPTDVLSFPLLSTPHACPLSKEKEIMRLVHTDKRQTYDL